jgi:predicted lipoprotein with Yx(FWY)xxD motif
MISGATTLPQAPRPPRRGPGRSLATLVVLAVVGVIAAACGSSTPSASSSTTTTSASPAGTTGTTGAPGQVVADVVSNAKIGKSILINSSGMTLYKFSADSSTMSACNGGCATAWPPLTVPTGTTPKGGPGTGGTFGTITRSDGSTQITYDGNPLYTFSGDSSAGATNGQNLTSDGGTWTVVTIGSTSSASTSPPNTNATTTTKPSSGGYGY